ncbi:hypothetical protein ACPA9J_07695 [Pseudomonas aeruginosa]
MISSARLLLEAAAGHQALVHLLDQRHRRRCCPAPCLVCSASSTSSGPAGCAACRPACCVPFCKALIRVSILGRTAVGAPRASALAPRRRPRRSLTLVVPARAAPDGGTSAPAGWPAFGHALDHVQHAADALVAGAQRLTLAVAARTRLAASRSDPLQGLAYHLPADADLPSRFAAPRGFPRRCGAPLRRCAICSSSPCLPVRFSACRLSIPRRGARGNADSASRKRRNPPDAVLLCNWLTIPQAAGQRRGIAAISWPTSSRRSPSTWYRARSPGDLAAATPIAWRSDGRSAGR